MWQPSCSCTETISVDNVSVTTKMRSFPIWGSRPPNRKEAHLGVSQASNIAQIIIKVDNLGFNRLLINNSEYSTDTIKVVPLRTTKHGNAMLPYCRPTITTTPQSSG